MARGSPCLRQLIDGQAARIRQPEEPRHLVVGLAGGVVARAAHPPVASEGLAPRRGWCARRRRPARGTAARAASGSRRTASRCPSRWLTPTKRHARWRRLSDLATCTPTSSAPISPGPRGDRDEVQVLERHARALSASWTTGHHLHDVVAAGELRAPRRPSGGGCPPGWRRRRRARGGRPPPRRRRSRRTRSPVRGRAPPAVYRPDRRCATSRRSSSRTTARTSADSGPCGTSARKRR